MASRVEQFKQHNVHNELEGFKTAIAALLPEDIATMSDQVARFKHIAVALEDALSRLDVQLNTTARLDQIASHAMHMKNALQAFHSNKDLSNLSTVEAHADALADVMAGLNLTEKKAGKASADLIAAYEQGAQQLTGHFEARFADFKSKHIELQNLFDSKLAELSSDFDRQKQALADSFTERATKLSDDLDKTNEDLTEQKARVSELGSQFTEQFSKAQENRLNSFNEEIKKLNKNYDALVEGVEQKSMALIEAMEKKDEEASKILNVVGAKSFSTHYKKQADSERISATVFQILALVLLGIAAYSVYNFSVASTANVGNTQDAAAALQAVSSSGIADVITHILIYIALLTPALYCAFESAKHRRQEYKNRQFELEMAAVQPYFATIPESPEKDNKRIALADRFFGQQTEDKLEAWTPPAVRGANKLLQTLGDVANKIQK